MDTKLHEITDTSGRPIRFFITAGQVSDYTGAAALMNGLPEAELPPELWTLTQAAIFCLLIFNTKEIRNVETEATSPRV